MPRRSPELARPRRSVRRAAHGAQHTARRQIVRTTASSWLTNTTVVPNVAVSSVSNSKIVACTDRPARR